MKALVLLCIVMFATAETKMQNGQIECLRSIKESFQDPLNSLSSWKFDGKSDDFICEFGGVYCLGRSDENMTRDNAILSIRLIGMGLSGEFPRGIANCSSLVSLDLSRNDLYGSIPSDISTIIPYLSYIDLSFNRFSGQIPLGFANCSFLNFILLNNNLLTGKIPGEIKLLEDLRYFSVANNLLSGPIPRFVYFSFPAQSYENNLGLCGEPLEPCRSWKTDFTNGFLVGWAVFFLPSLLFGLFVPFSKFANRFKKRKRTTAPRFEFLLSSKNRTDQIYEIPELENLSVPSMILAELNKVTDGFSQNHVVGRGEDGTLYKAVLKNGWSLAIKRLHPLHPLQEFLTEIVTLGRIKHNNLVPLMGFCCELNERMLIYKFMPIGSLYDCLFPSDGKSVVLEWPVKVKIAIGIAKGVAWLHQNGVVHRGITSKCVLLDQDLDPKISDFGRATPIICNHTDYTSECEQYSWNRDFLVPSTYVEDVYGFGMLLLELVTGKKDSDVMDYFERIDGNLIDVVTNLLGIDHDATASHFLRIAGECVECEPGKWPSMVEVYQKLVGTKTPFLSG